MTLISKDAQCYDRSYCIHEFFFVRFLVFELLSILYFTVVISLLDWVKNLVGFIAKYVVDANLFRLESTNPKKNNSAPVFFWLLYRGPIPGGLCPGGFCPGDFCRGTFDLEPQELCHLGRAGSTWEAFCLKFCTLRSKLELLLCN